MPVQHARSPCPHARPRKHLSPRLRLACRSYFGEFGPSPSDENEAFRSRLSPDGAELERMSYSDEECAAVAKMRAFFEVERPELPNRRHREQMPHAFPRL